MDAEATMAECISGIEDTGKNEKKETWLFAGAAGLFLMAVTMLTVNAYADLPTEIAGAVSKLYNDIKAIVTPVAAVSFVIALMVSFLSHSQKSVDTARQTAKGILTTWIVIMLVGSIFTYADSILSSNFSDNTLPGVTAGSSSSSSSSSSNSSSSSTTNKTVKVTKITLSKTSVSVTKGKTTTLKATVAPTNAKNKAVTWKSSNTKVATVTSKGTVKGVKAGTATITCTAKDGSGKKATCKVTVK